MPRMSFHWLFAWLVPLTLGISFNISSSKNPFLTSPSANPTYILHSTYQAAIMHSFTWFACLLSVSYTGMQASGHQGSCPTSHCCMLTAKKSAWYIRNTGSIDSLIFYFVCLCICWTLFIRHLLGHLFRSLPTEFTLINLVFPGSRDHVLWIHIWRA